MAVMMRQSARSVAGTCTHPILMIKFWLKSQTQSNLLVSLASLLLLMQSHSEQVKSYSQQCFGLCACEPYSCEHSLPVYLLEVLLTTLRHSHAPVLTEASCELNTHPFTS